MSNTAILAVKILGDSDDAQRALKDLDKSVAVSDANTKKAGKSMKGVWAGVAAAVGACVVSASKLGAATNGLTVIFGDAADEMLTWAEGMADMGLSTAQAAGAATVLGAQMKNLGATTEQAAVITQGLIETASQLAAVLGGSAVEAVGAMGAAMRGEYDSLERYGISLTADAVATEVARLASLGFTGATEQQANAVATLSLIQQQATAITGEGTEATVTMSSATDHLRASIANLTAAVGENITANGQLVEATADVIDKLVTQTKESDLLASASDLLAQGLKDIQEILDPLLSAALELVSDLFDKLATFIDEYMSPILDALAEVLDKVADALSVVIGWVQDAIDWFDQFTDSVHEAIDALTFWNDTYDPNAASTQAIDDPVPSSRSRAAPAANAAAQPRMVITDEQLARAISALLFRSEIRNGRMVA